MSGWWQSLTFARRSGAILLTLIILTALLGPALATDPVSQDLDRVLRSPSLEQPLGTSIADAVMTLPVLLVVLLFSAFAQGEFWSLYIGLSFALWVEYFRVSRATIKATLVSAPVESARMLGFGTLYLLRRHLLPELAPVVGTLMLFGISTAILALAALGFVGVGLRPPTPELGVMMIELFPYYEEAPWLIASPVVTLGLIMLALALLGGRKEMP